MLYRFRVSLSVVSRLLRSATSCVARPQTWLWLSCWPMESVLPLWYATSYYRTRTRYEAGRPCLCLSHVPQHQEYALCFMLSDAMNVWCSSFHLPDILSVIQPYNAETAFAYWNVSGTIVINVLLVTVYVTKTILTNSYIGLFFVLRFDLEWILSVDILENGAR